MTQTDSISVSSDESVDEASHLFKPNTRLIIMLAAVRGVGGVGGVGFLHSRSFFNQKSLEMSPVRHFNKGLQSSRRNPVAIDAPEEGLGRDVADRFDGVSVEGYEIFVHGEAVDDHFAGCAQGADPLLHMSNFLLQSHGEEEEGASR